ncbi:MAG: type II secretion system protein M [Solirubrobacteraceae bacterium]|nr:type II secretion system protein M [Solirubrobacteraceae bacterium]
MTTRDRNMVLVVLGVILLGGFWFLLLTPQRKAAADAQTQVTNARLELDAAQQKLNAGRAAQQEFRRDRTTIVKLGRVVPETDDIPTLLTQLEALSKKEKVDFLSYSIDAAGGQSSADTTGAGDSTSTGAQTGTRSTDTVAPLFAPGSVETAGGLGRTPIALKLKGTYFELERYLRAVQRFAVLSANRSQTADGRLIIVDGFSYQPIETSTEVTDDGQIANKKKPSRSPDLTATLSASVYFAPPLETPSAAAAAATPAPVPAGDGAAVTPAPSTGAATVGALR